MTREQRAAAGFGSVIAVGLLLVITWSIPGGLVVLILGLAVCVALLRLTHPKGSRRPTAGNLGLLGAPPAPTEPLSEADLAAQKAELERRRAEDDRRRHESERTRDEERERRRQQRESAAAERAAAKAERRRA